MPKALSLETVLSFCDERNITLLEYGGAATKSSRFRCNIDAYEWTAKIHTMRASAKCPKCAGNVAPALDEVRQFCIANNIELVSYAGNSKDKSTFMCSKGHVWTTSFASFKKSGRCQKCIKRLKLTVAEVVTYCNSKKIDLIVYGGNVDSISQFKCQLDGYTWSTTLNSLRCGSGCPRCTKKARWDAVAVKEFCNDIGLILVNYGGSVKKQSQFMCQICGYTWDTSFDSIRTNKTSCHRCATKWAYNNISFDSSWELIFYLYYLKRGNSITRLEGRNKKHRFKYDYQGAVRYWYPDFLMEGLYYEIKPDKGYWRDTASIAISNAKKVSNSEVKWVSDAEIMKMSKIVGDVSKYRRHKKL